MTAQLRVSYVGGPLDGLVRWSDDDQVPALVATSEWQHYQLTGRVKMNGLLVGAVYRHIPGFNP